MKFRRPILAVTLILVASMDAIVASADDVGEKLRAAATGEHRSVANIARNQYRHPIETLEWFGLHEDMTVVEIWPGSGGWYTEVLSPFLRPRGAFYVAVRDGKPGSYYFKSLTKFRTHILEQADVYESMTLTELTPPEKTTIAPPGSADLVVSFRSMHNMIRSDETGVVFDAIYAVLKPGGILGVVQHRGDSDMPSAEWAEKGYVREDDAIAIIEEAGFEFVGKSEINANSKDTKRYAKGVWTLPPTLLAGDSEKYEPIGESDRMTLKFRKPR